MSSDTKKPSMISRVGKLYHLLELHFPDHRSVQGVLNIPGLAKDLGFAHETLYRCVRNDCVRTRIAFKLLEYSHANHPEQPLYWQDLLLYILTDFKKYSDPGFRAKYSSPVRDTG